MRTKKAENELTKVTSVRIPEVLYRKIQELILTHPALYPSISEYITQLILTDIAIRECKDNEDRKLAIELSQKNLEFRNTLIAVMEQNDEYQIRDHKDKI